MTSRVDERSQPCFHLADGMIPFLAIPALAT